MVDKFEDFENRGPGMHMAIESGTPEGVMLHPQGVPRLKREGPARTEQDRLSDRPGPPIVTPP
jgi:hypothetical protein